MTRLNKNIKEEIANNAVIKSGVLEKLEAAFDERASFLKKLRLDHLGGKSAETKMLKTEKRYLDWLSSLPEGTSTGARMLRRDHDVMLNVGGEREHLYYHGADTQRSREPISVVTPYMLTIQGGSDLQKEYLNIRHKIEALHDERSNIKRNVLASMSSITTVKALLKAWPESKELIPSNLEEAAANLPALETSTLNEMIGLPTKQKAAA